MVRIGVLSILRRHGFSPGRQPAAQTMSGEWFSESRGGRSCQEELYFCLDHHPGCAERAPYA